jgi:pyruvate-formate lyase-activating enzyme
VIPGANLNSKDFVELSDIAEFLRELNINKCELMPYHKLGESKYKSLGMKDSQVFDAPDDNFIDNIKNLFRKKGINI